MLYLCVTVSLMHGSFLLSLFLSFTQLRKENDPISCDNITTNNSIITRVWADLIGAEKKKNREKMVQVLKSMFTLIP